jgi:hypothetical protein
MIKIATGNIHNDEDFRNNISFYIKNIDEVLGEIQLKAEEIKKERDADQDA